MMNMNNSLHVMYNQYSRIFEQKANLNNKCAYFNYVVKLEFT